MERFNCSIEGHFLGKHYEQKMSMINTEFKEMAGERDLTERQERLKLEKNQNG